METVIYECIALGVDAVLFALCYKYYQMKSRDVKAVKEAPSLIIDKELKDKVQSCGNCIPYAVISGSVKATSKCLPSKHVPGLTGVIQELVTKERKAVWSSLLRIWTTEEEIIHRSKNIVPFALAGTSHWLKSPVYVEVLEPLQAEELTLSPVYSVFTPHERTFKDIISGLFFDEQMTGVLETEEILMENTSLIGVGTIILEEGTLKIKPPPSAKATFFLTPLSYELLSKKLSEDARFYKFLSINLATVGFFLLSYMLLKLYRARKRRLEAKREVERRHEATRRHRLENSSTNVSDENNPRCVVCLTNPIEAVVLECGHTCLCLSCSEHIGSLCPICREYIDRIVPAYLP